MVMRWPLSLAVMSITKRTANCSPFTYGPSTFTSCTSWAPAHHSPLARAADLPWLSVTSPMASTLSTSSAQYFSPASSNLPCRHRVTRSLATSCVVIGGAPCLEPDPRPALRQPLAAGRRSLGFRLPPLAELGGDVLGQAADLAVRGGDLVAGDAPALHPVLDRLALGQVQPLLVDEA